YADLEPTEGAARSHRRCGKRSVQPRWPIARLGEYRFDREDLGCADPADPKPARPHQLGGERRVQPRRKMDCLGQPRWHGEVLENPAAPGVKGSREMRGVIMPGRSTPCPGSWQKRCLPRISNGENIGRIRLLHSL